MSKQIVKISEGYVKQIFDVQTRELVSQEFVAVDQVEFEDENGVQIDHPSFKTLYHPFDMVQPDKDGELLSKAFAEDQNRLENSN